MHVEKASVIPSRSERIVPTRPLALPKDRDFSFELSVQGIVYLVEHGMSSILVRNNSDLPIQIPGKTRLGNVIEMDYDNCFQADVDTDFAAVPTQG